MEEENLACQRAPIFEGEAIEPTARSRETSDRPLLDRDPLAREVSPLSPTHLRTPVGAEDYVLAPGQQEQREPHPGRILAHDSHRPTVDLPAVAVRAVESAMTI